MADYCSNSVIFLGSNSGRALDYFASLEGNVSPFLEISIYKDTVNFESRWVPPIKELNRIAETFDVSYDLHYHIPDKDRRSSAYICLDHQPLSPIAERIRHTLKEISSLEELEGAELTVGELLFYQTLNMRELGVLACMLKKRQYALEPSLAEQNDLSEKPGTKPWENNDSATDRGRKR
jgi:hypothetical protein